MTCIIGLVDKENGVSWIGGDSLGSNGYTKATNTQSKVFKNNVFPNVLIGGTGTFRHLDLLKYSDTLFDEIDFYRKSEITHEFMVTKFIPRVITLFGNGIICEPSTERGCNFIVATPGTIFEVQGDYSVLEPELGFCAVGCGEAVAMGSLITTNAMDIAPQEKIARALDAAEKYCCGVQRPFHIMCTDGRDEIIIK